jgi:hypothetical protein
MAITTLDGIIAGAQQPRIFSKATSGTLVAGRPVTYWGIAGNPGAGSWDSTLNGVVTYANTAGTVNFVNPTSGSTYLNRLQASATQAGTLMLVDRLWHNGGFTITATTPQNITQPTLPPRDLTGTTAGNGVFAAAMLSVASGAGTPTITITYTNSSGASGRSSTNVLATAATSVAGSWYMMGLQAGDNGIRNVASLTLSATWTSGTLNLGLFRLIAALEMPQAFVPNAIDALTSGMPVLYNDSALEFVFMPNTTTASVIQGQLGWSQG